MIRKSKLQPWKIGLCIRQVISNSSQFLEIIRNLLTYRIKEFMTKSTAIVAIVLENSVLITLQFVKQKIYQNYSMFECDDFYRFGRPKKKKSNTYAPIFIVKKFKTDKSHPFYLNKNITCAIIVHVLTIYRSDCSCVTYKFYHLWHQIMYLCVYVRGTCIRGENFNVISIPIDTQFYKHFCFHTIQSRWKQWFRSFF